MQAHSGDVIPTNYTPFDTEVQQQSESVHHDNDINKPSMAVPNVLDGMVRDRDERPFSRLSDAVIPEPVVSKICIAEKLQYLLVNDYSV